MKKKWFELALGIPRCEKLFLIMRLTLFLVLGIVINSMASGFAQNTKLNLNLENKQIREILNEIENQSEYTFMYDNQKVDVERRVTIRVNTSSIEETLSQIFRDEQIDFRIIDRHVMIYPKEGNGVAQQQVKSVSGKVSDSSGQPLPGVTVIIKGTTQGTVTNPDGNYLLSSIPGDAILQFSFVGMKTQELEIGDQTSIDVVLETDAIGLEEVVAIGYGVMKKSDLTGSVTKVNVEELAELPNVSIIQAMQGTVAGLNVGAVDEAGENPTISIRGQNTLSNSAGANAPLIVVDGIIYRGNIIDLNTSDIESIDILKDASSTAIYGSQAANGVMIITTKRGREEGKPVINYSGSYTFQVPRKNLEPMGGDELAGFLNDLFWAQGSRIGPDYLQHNPEFVFTPFLRNSQIADNFENGIENDWWGVLTGNGYINRHNISLSGKNQRLTYFLSGGFSDVDGFMENEKYKKYNYRINIDAEVNSILNLGIESFFTTSDYSGVSPRISDSFTMYPWAPIYNENGEFALTPDSRGLNPFLEMQQDDSDKRMNLFANLHADIKLPFLKGFNYRINYSQNYRTTNQDRFNPWGASYTGSGYKNLYTNYDWSLDNIFTYNKTFLDDHKINFTFVYGVEERQYSFTQSSAQNFSNKLLGFNRLHAGDPSLNVIKSGKEKENSLYSMARLQYNLKNKYLLTGTLRRDGFSGFGSNEKIGVFPSLAFAWVLSEENFMKDKVEWLDYLKIRTSYGKSGRRAVGRYDTQAVVSSQPSVVFGDGGNATLGQWISSLSNNDLGWETTTGLNIGADFAVIDSKLHGNIEYYNNDTKDILYNIQLPTMTGFSSIATNIGKVHNWGLEYTLTAQIIKNADFSWESSVNFSRNRNEIVSILGPENDQDGDGKEDDLIANNLFIGEPMNVNYNYEVIGMWQLADQEAGVIPAGFAPGTYILANVDDSDDVITGKDKKILGYKDPSYRLGVSNTFKYKNFSLYVFVNSIQGGKDYYQANLSFMQNPWHKLDQLIYSTPPSGAWDYWMPENPDAKFRRPDDPSQLGRDTGPHEQRNFIRLQDVSLSYTFNSAKLKQYAINNLKVFVSGKNLITLTKWDGWDPETGLGFTPGRPVMKNYTLGVNVEF